ncbi:QsdR family transcriptional regulator [Tsukamurella ocularis]|uniref:QsdR family transcriptional regulator n=1 Tax=Tsukamurella ocularis TaxID=1970234 RepID=UPI002168052A|nr:QsdR family transcriptional regulator [Tsukamurella ocularis]MCS3780130.1 AcrR family transcriptional regulator [Tsukamurella ocularis]MCS3786316.1 AcrR family transcriptional regulator [Tsukamurella ocularis]MCS3849680.1 AcrR family transcriptional regulator [Tsukamurella ocularis]
MSHPERPDNQVEVIHRAAQWFREGRRVDLGQLAKASGIGRATLYRWFEGRDQVVGEAIWLGIAQAIARVEADEPVRDRAAFLRSFGRLAHEVRDYPPLAGFATDEPEFAMRVLQSGGSVVQARLIEWVAGWLADIAVPTSDAARGVSRADLAYAIVRLAESFLWSDMIIGTPSQPDKAAAVVELLLDGAGRT